VRELLRFPPNCELGELHPAHPYHRLMRTINGTSYLDTMHQYI
jgi:hypothetical protein